MKISLGIITWKDRVNLRDLMESVSSQRLRRVHLDEILIVAPAEDSVFIDTLLTAHHSWRLPVRVLTEGHRLGKYAAVNIFLREATSPVLVLCSGDVVLHEDALERLCAPLADKKIGIVASRPVPRRGQKSSLMDDVAELLWELHDDLSARHPKFGELVAFRNLGFQLPRTAVDEEMIAALVTSQGYRETYARDAVVNNRGAQHISDYLRQRRRIYAGHLELRRETGRAVPSLGSVSLARLAIAARTPAGKRKRLRTLAAGIALEGASRVLGYLDYLRKKDHSSWEPIPRE